MIKFGWKGIALAILIDIAFSALLGKGIGTFLGIMTFIVLVVIRQVENAAGKEKKKNRHHIEDYTKGGGSLTVAQVDLLYREYASVIDGYHITPLPMFMDVLGKDRMHVMSDLNILINNGRFQQARVEYDDNTFVVDEYTKERPAAERTKFYGNGGAGYQEKTENAARSDWQDEPVYETSGQRKSTENVSTKDRQAFAQSKRSIVEAVESTVSYVREEDMRNVLSGIERSVNDIVTKLSEDPDLNTGDTRRLLTFYLPKAVECINHYRTLLQKNYLTDLEESAKSDLEAALKAMDQSFRKIRDSLSNNDAIDISAEAKAIQMMLKNDGLTEEILHMTPEKEKVYDRRNTEN